MNALSNLVRAIGYPETVADGTDVFTFRVDGGEVVAQTLGSRLILKRYLEVSFDDLSVFAMYAAGRMLREESVLAWDTRAERAFLWREIPGHADLTALKEAFEDFADSCDWWIQRAAETAVPQSVFPDIMIRP